MASKKKDTPSDSKKGYQPKATARHAKMVRTKQEEIDSFKKKIETDKYLAKKYESSRRTEIKALPKEERAAAKAELKESIEKRKEAERRDRDRLRDLIYEERAEKRDLGKEQFDEDAWVKSGKKGRADSKPPEEAPAPDDETAETLAETPEAAPEEPGDDAADYPEIPEAPAAGTPEPAEPPPAEPEKEG